MGRTDLALAALAVGSIIGIAACERAKGPRVPGSRIWNVELVRPTEKAARRRPFRAGGWQPTR